MKYVFILSVVHLNHKNQTISTYTFFSSLTEKKNVINYNQNCMLNLYARLFRKTNLSKLFL